MKYIVDQSELSLIDLLEIQEEARKGVIEIDKDSLLTLCVCTSARIVMVDTLERLFNKS